VRCTARHRCRWSAIAPTTNHTPRHTDRWCRRGQSSAE
jgi:hypothetical protein